ncbi:MAG: 4Fe-4S binding protein [Desulfobulbaceae bacterium]|uniref:4Fe-4S binding protein n=1 Tax=Candidatus Desulfobia pelagia TaxID=2841692 RepID=A0A8J6NBT6_9BACT|nr:4Fe-4S binding protein [Candidatus Desulfobia pelagia]
MALFHYIPDVTTLELNQELCIGCGICLVVCPHDVFVLKDKKALIANKDNCMECNACAVNCPPRAISVESGEGCVRSIINELLGRECDCC